MFHVNTARVVRFVICADNMTEKKHKHGTKKDEMAQKMGHNPAHNFRHRASQMKSISGGKWGKKLNSKHENEMWNYARENRMTDKRIF